ncbi:AAA ATPase domain-containing protein [Paenibacillaceae bacterium GAS479]|nr:AAA ATPase domain-containing protein [Paenibacillaceae bacterium GAS479]
MNYLIKELVVENNDNYHHVGVDNNNLMNLSKINLFIGSNNSGKSRYIRQIFKQTNYRIKPFRLDFSALNILIEKYSTEITNLFNQYQIKNYGTILDDLSTFQHVEYIQNDTFYLEKLKSNVDYISNINTDQMVTSQFNHYNLQHHAIRQQLNDIGSRYSSKIKNFMGSQPDMYSFKKVYIPTLRGLRTFSDNKDYYANRTVKDYFPGLNDNGSIFTGLEMYQMVKNLLLGDLDAREKITDFQTFLGETFFDGESVALIPSINSDVLNVKIGKEKERPIFGMGDGIQSIIVLTFPLFINRDENLLVFIEEPELYLHPGLQRKLIETFISFSNFQYFITTHSNHFLDITLDIEQISIYTFRKHFESDETKREVTANFLVENTSNEDNTILEMIGVKSSSVFLSNCTIWVEGITDRYYLRHYLGLYMRMIQTNNSIVYKEDLHYSFVEYSGSNITHWSFLDDDITTGEPKYRSMNADRLCSRLFLITDKDSEIKLERQRKLKRKLGARYYCLKGREIENLISKNVLLQVIADYENKSVDELQFRTTVSEKAYKENYLGTYIENNLLQKQRRGNYKASSGTISDKLGFCKRAIENTKEIRDLSAEALKVVKKIHEFIVEQNK